MLHWVREFCKERHLWLLIGKICWAGYGTGGRRTTKALQQHQCISDPTWPAPEGCQIADADSVGELEVGPQRAL